MAMYSYAIEMSDDGKNWTPEDADAAGAEQSDLAPRDFGRRILADRPEEMQPQPTDGGRPVDPRRVRVVVWHGDRPGTTGDAAAVVEH